MVYLGAKKLFAKENNQLLREQLLLEDRSHNYLSKDLKNYLPADYCWYLKHVMNQKQAEMQWLVTYHEEHPEIIMNLQSDDGICSGVFMCHSKYQLQILKTYNASYDIDTTFNITNIESKDSDMWHVLNIVTQDCNHKSFIVGSCIFQSNRKDRSAYNRIYEIFKQILITNDIPMPKSIGVDRELASLHACIDVFPKTYIYLCTKHIRSDIEKWLLDKTSHMKDLEKKAKSMETVQKLLGSVMDMFEMKVMEDEYEQHKSTLLSELARSRSDLSTNFHKYLTKEWIHYDKHIAAAYRLKRLTYGKRTTNCAEASHFSLKHYTRFRSNRFKVFVVEYVSYVEDQYTKFEQGKVITTISFYCYYY